MSSTITKVMAIRVKNETADYFRGKPLNRTVESIHKLVKEKKVEIRGDGEIIISDNTDKRQGSSDRSR